MQCDPITRLKALMALVLSTTLIDPLWIRQTLMHLDPRIFHGTPPFLAFGIILTDIHLLLHTHSCPRSN